MKQHNYSVFLINLKGERTPIIEAETSVTRVRNVALGLKQKPNRRVLVVCDGKELAGWRFTLDSIVYAQWLEKCDEELRALQTAEEKQ